ncbi:MAG: methyltransferase [Sphingobium sp.]|nr:methyltransferase [Sphingobium sp.]
MHSFSENLKFFRQFLRSPKMVGSVIPTSRQAIDALLSEVDWSKADVFVEYGPGVGTFTYPILKRLRPDARLIAIDTCRDFIDHLGASAKDPRLTLVHGSASDVKDILEKYAPGQQANYVLSGLPFSTLPEGVGDDIVAATAQSLAPDGAFLIYQYSRFVVPMLRRHFTDVRSRRHWVNIPPCYLITARQG